MSIQDEQHDRPVILLVSVASNEGLRPPVGSVGIIASQSQDAPPIGFIGTQQVYATFETKAVTDARFRLLVDALYALLMRGSSQSDPEELARCTHELGLLRQRFANEDATAPKASDTPSP